MIAVSAKTKRLQIFLGRVTLLALLLLLLLPSVLAFGIKPAQKTIAFEPNLTIDAQFDLVRDTEAPGIALIETDGDLAQYITIPGTVPLTGSAQSIRYSVKLPQSLPPGTHVGKIIVSEQSSATGVINSRLRITFKVFVSVPGEIPVTAEVINQQGTLSIVPSVQLKTPQKVSVNDAGLSLLSLFALVATVFIYVLLTQIKRK